MTGLRDRVVDRRKHFRGMTHMKGLRRVIVVLTACLAGGANAQAQETVVYYHTDAIGSVRMITDENGQVVARYDYLPFGEPWVPPPNQDVRQFAGKERDAETGFDYFGARYYASGIGRFSTVDPDHVNGDIHDPQSWNSYAYARNNPLRVTDPDGREYEICTHAIVGVSCTTVRDRQFEKLARNPGAGIELRNNTIYAGNEVAGYYRQISIDPTFVSVFGNAGLLADAWLKASASEMAKNAAIAATGGLAAGAFGGGLAATSTLGLKAASMTEIANATASGARIANLSVNLTAREFQVNLVRSGYRVVRQGVGTNGPFTVLSKGEKTYTIYTASSTGGASAQVRVAGQTVSKIRLSGF